MPCTVSCRAAPVYFVVSAVFHYLGPAFAVLLTVRVEVLGVAWLRIAAAAAVFALAPAWRVVRSLDRDGRRLLVSWGAVLALMNCCFYLSIDRLPLGTVAADRVPPRSSCSPPWAPARRATRGRSRSPSEASTCSRTSSSVLGVAFAFASRRPVRPVHRAGAPGSDARRAGSSTGSGASMLVALVAVTPLAGWEAAPALVDPVAAGRGGRGAVVVGHSLRDRPAGDGAARAGHLRADGLAAAGRPPS